jgi:hypothetical protein
MIFVYPTIIIWIGLFSPGTDGKTIQGESSQTSLGRENSIECLSYHD